MPGRNAKPINILEFEGKKHLTKSEKEARRAAEIKIGDNNFICPDYIRSDPMALSKWKELIKLFSIPEAKDLITSWDSDAIAMYCQTFSEERTLIDLRARAKTDRARIKYTNQLLKTRDMRIKLSNNLFLNPLAKIKNVPKSTKPKEEDPLRAAGFGNL